MSMLKNPTEMGMAHAAYGMFDLPILAALTRFEGTGALVSPLISTQFAQYTGRKWALYYTFLLGTLIINLTILVWRFRGREYDGTPTSPLA